MNHLDATLLKSATQTHRHVGTEIEVLSETDSTNDRCHEYALQGRPAGLVIFADHQSRGRGQHGSRWVAPPGTALLFSILLEPPEALAGPVFLTAWSALSLAEVLGGLGLDARIKWPNDLLIDQKKLAGILTERRRGAVVGIGLNVTVEKEDLPSELRLPPTSVVAEAQRPVDRTELAIAILKRLEQRFAEAIDHGAESILQAWTSHALHQPGDRVIAVTRQLTLEGELTDLRPDRGCRLLRTNGTATTIPPEELLRLDFA
ncbi:Bifunctional ligase/repressor BirA [Planctomycetes bacterium Pan216]|uniref:Bifunctional ligase/repressor BirA n=1 Tax=Kolteria novifilia TaxID=2527975 RepID=A0A518B9I0_9BACT|nr:Bifunctional ligase/repressor BirA [Planctomycetes bacterium Pan216]